MRRRSDDMEAPPLATLYNPSDTLSTGEFFKTIGEVTNNEPAWMTFHTAIMATAAASSIYLLKCMRDAEVDLALSSCKMSTGYKNALCEYLSPHGKPPHTFVGVSTNSETKKKVHVKKFDSQRDRSSLGNEIGGEALMKVTFPDGLFDGITCSREVSMKSGGRHGTCAVSNRVWSWAIAKWGNLHVDQTFCDRMDTLLSER